MNTRIFFPSTIFCFVTLIFGMKLHAGRNVLHEALADMRLKVVDRDPDGYTGRGAKSYESPADSSFSHLLNRADVAELLEERDAHAETPIFYAIRRGDQSFVEQLCRAGANLLIRNAYNMSPLELAQNRGGRTDIVKILTRYYNEQVADRSVEEVGVNEDVLSDQHDEDTSISPMLMMHQFNSTSVNNPDYLGRSPLHFVRSGEAVDALCQKGARLISGGLGVRDHAGWSPLHEAAYGGRDHAMRRLLGLVVRDSKSFTTDLKTRNGDTLWHLAAYRGNIEILQTLGDAASLHETYKKEIEPYFNDLLSKIAEKTSMLTKQINNLWWKIDEAEKAGNQETAHVLRNTKQKVLAELKRLEELEVDVKKCQDNAAANLKRLQSWDRHQLEIKNKEGQTPLQEAVRQRHIGVVEELCKQGADVNVRDGKRRQPLYWAVRYRRDDIATLLLNRGSSEDLFADEAGVRAYYEKKLQSLPVSPNQDAEQLELLEDEQQEQLRLAVRKENLGGVIALCDKVDNLNVQDSKGRTPLYWAVRNRDLDITLVLLRHGASTYIFEKESTLLPEVDKQWGQLVVELQQSILDTRMLSESDKKWGRSVADQFREQKKAAKN